MTPKQIEKFRLSLLANDSWLNVATMDHTIKALMHHLKPQMLHKVDELTGIKKGDTLMITGDDKIRKLLKVQAIKVSEHGTEVIIDKKWNRFFNLDMYITGASWVKDLYIL